MRTRFEVKRSKVKVTGLINAETEVCRLRTSNLVGCWSMCYQLPWLTIKVCEHWRIQDFRFGGQVERRRREYRGAVGAEGCGRGLWRGVSPPQKKFEFFASEWFILRAFWHMIRQLTTPVIRLKPAKSSDVVTKPCKVVIILSHRQRRCKRRVRRGDYTCTLWPIKTTT